MSAQPSRNLESKASPYPGGCPRCGTRITQNYKYCPNCAYRLRPDVSKAPGPRAAPSGPRSQRILALGGYLAFASLLLLVVLAGIRLFSDQDVFLGVAEQSTVPRDLDAFAIDPDSYFVEVPGGEAIYGPPDLPERVRLVDDPFRLGAYEVTNDQYYAFLLARAERTSLPIPMRLYPRIWNRRTGNRLVQFIYRRDRGNHPVRGIEFGAAVEFCAWLWEDAFGSDPDVIVDLPTASEWIRAARRDYVERYFPWPERRLRSDLANLDGQPRPVNDPAMGPFEGFHALIGNVAEWVRTDRGPAGAGWSFLDGAYKAAWNDLWVRNKPTPFTTLQPVFQARAEAHIGFRVVVRHAPALPRFVSVEGGPVQPRIPRTHPSHTLKELPGRAPPIGDPNDLGWIDQGIEAVIAPRKVPETFEISRAEVTNRQYLLFLVEQARDNQRPIPPLPASFTRPHPNGDWMSFKGDPMEAEDELEAFRKLRRLSKAHLGPFGPPSMIPFVFEAGAANEPVRGIRVEQARAYADWLTRRLHAGSSCRLPTLAEYLRAGRGARTTPYPWGENGLDPRLISAGRRDDEDRPVSAGRFPNERIFGLVGNVMEMVYDRMRQRVLFAGGWYKLPAGYCTLDTLIDSETKRVELTVDSVEVEYFVPPYVGFRVVRISRF